MKFFLGSSDLPNFKRHILASKQNFQAWISLRDSIGQPTSVKERRNIYSIFKNFKCSTEHLFQALLVKTEKEKVRRNSEEAFENNVYNMNQVKLILFQGWSLFALVLTDIWAVSVLYLSTASFSLEIWRVIKK